MASASSRRKRAAAYSCTAERASSARGNWLIVERRQVAFASATASPSSVGTQCISRAPFASQKSKAAGVAGSPVKPSGSEVGSACSVLEM